MKKKGIISIIGVVTLLSLAGYFVAGFLNNYTTQLLKEKLSNGRHLYEIEFDNFEFSLWSGNAEMTNISMQLNQEYADSLKQANAYPKALYSGAVERVSLNGINALNVYFSKEIHIANAKISNPNINLTLTHSTDTTNALTKATEGGVKGLLEYVNHSSIHEFEIQAGELTILSETTTGIDSVGFINGLDFKVVDFEIDTSISNNPYKVEEIALACKSAYFSTNSNLIGFKNFKASLSDSTLSLSNLNVHPIQSKKDFYAKTRYRSTWVDMESDELKGSGINFNRLFFKSEIDVNRLEIVKPIISVAKNKNKSYQPGTRFKTPIAVLRKLPIHLNISELKIIDANYKNEQRINANGTTSNLNMDKMYVSVYNATNDSAAIASNSTMEIAIQSELINTTTLRGNLKFDLASNNESFDGNFNLSSTPLSPFNDLLKPFLNIELSSGKLNEALVTIKGNRYKIIGTTELDYNNLQIAVKDDNHRLLHRIKNAVLSEIANTVLRTNNEKSSPHFKKGVIDYEYNRKEPFFRNIWLATQGGIVNTVFMLPFES